MANINYCLPWPPTLLPQQLLNSLQRLLLCLAEVRLPALPCPYRMPAAAACKQLLLPLSHLPSVSTLIQQHWTGNLLIESCCCCCCCCQNTSTLPLLPPFSYPCLPPREEAPSGYALTAMSVAPASGCQALLGCLLRYSATLGRSGVPPSRNAVWNVSSICCSAR
jgi:hypothetical protein